MDFQIKKFKSSANGCVQTSNVCVSKNLMTNGFGCSVYNIFIAIVTYHSHNKLLRIWKSLLTGNQRKEEMIVEWGMKIF